MGRMMLCASYLPACCRTYPIVCRTSVPKKLSVPKNAARNLSSAYAGQPCFSFEVAFTHYAVTFVLHSPFNWFAGRASKIETSMMMTLFGVNHSTSELK